jgi:hypothetical protein
MAKKTTSKVNGAFFKAPRAHATLDHWVGKDQFQGDGVSTDPEISWTEPKHGTTRKTGVEKQGPHEVDIP